MASAWSSWYLVVPYDSTAWLAGTGSCSVSIVIPLELCFNEGLTPVSVDKVFNIHEAAELDCFTGNVVNSVVTGFDADNVYCLVADGRHFVSLFLFDVVLLMY